MGKNMKSYGQANKESMSLRAQQNSNTLLNKIIHLLKTSVFRNYFTCKRNKRYQSDSSCLPFIKAREKVIETALI
jgi:hypothetical protein